MGRLGQGNKFEFSLLEVVAGAEASTGKLQDARQTYRQAMESARRAKFDGIAKNMAVDLDFVETLFGVVLN